MKVSSSCKSGWTKINAGVPQGTLLGPLAFLLHINSLHTQCNDVKYVDDTTVWERCSSDGSGSRLQAAADEVVAWTNANHMSLNVDKTKEMLLSTAREDHPIPALTLLGQPVERVENFKLLGVTINNGLSWNDHIDDIIIKASKRLYLLCLLKRAGLHSSDLLAIYTVMIRSVLEYGCEVWHPGLTKKLSKELEHIQKRVMRIVFPHHSYEDSLKSTGLPDLHSRREDICRTFFKKISCSESILHKYLPPKPSSHYNFREKKQFSLPLVRTNRLKNSPIFYGVFNFQ